MNPLDAKLETLTIAQLTDICRSLMNDFRDGADTVFTAAFALVQSRMTSAEFLALCGELESEAGQAPSPVPYARLDESPRMRIA